MTQYKTDQEYLTLREIKEYGLNHNSINRKDKEIDYLNFGIDWINPSYSQ